MNKIKVLIVDDNPEDIRIIREFLEHIKAIKFELSYEHYLDSTIDHLKKERFDCILLDLNLPDSTGIDTLKKILEKFPQLPIIVLTILDDEHTAIESLHYGAQDYLVKGKTDDEKISSSIRYAIERQNIENKLRDSEKKYRNIVDSIIQGLWVTDKEGNTTYINDQLSKMLGYDHDEIINHPFFDFVDDKLRHKAHQFFERRKQGIKDRYDFCFRKKDKTILWATVSASPIFDEDGKFAGAMGLISDITEKKYITDELQRSVQEWYSTFNAIADMICILNKEGEILRCNKSLQKFLKLPLENILGKKCWELFHNEFKPVENCPIMRMLNTKKRETSIIPVKDIWFHTSVDPITDDEGHVIGAVHIMSDITKYKLSQMELKESEEKWRSLTENSTEYIIIIDTKGNIQFANRKLPGIQKEAIINTNIYDYIPEKFLKNIEDGIEKVIGTKKSDKFYTEYINKETGNILSFDANITPITKKKEVTSFIISATDITDRKRMENKLRDSEEIYRTIIQYSNDMIWTLDRDGRFTYFNRQSEKISGYKLEEWRGKHFIPLIVDKDTQKVAEVFHAVLNGNPQQYEVTFKNKWNKLVTLSVNTAPIYSKGKVTGTVSFGRDITENKKAEEKIKRARKELERSNKELEQFAYVASHDLQEPLRSVAGFTELIARRYKGKLDQDADEFIEYIVNGTNRMRQMINDLLTLSRVGTRGQDFKSTNIQDILNHALNNLHSLIEKNEAEIIIGNMPTIKVDESQFMQLFQNLIENAIKFRREENPKIHISAEEKDNFWIFSVKDNGIGIDERDFNKLFVIFQRLHSREEYPGTGIGLAMCKKIVKRHGGKIWVESEIGKGSTFYFKVPIDINGETNINNE